MNVLNPSPNYNKQLRYFIILTENKLIEAFDIFILQELKTFEPIIQQIVGLFHWQHEGCESFVFQWFFLNDAIEKRPLIKKGWKYFDPLIPDWQISYLEPVKPGWITLSIEKSFLRLVHMVYLVIGPELGVIA